MQLDKTRIAIRERSLLEIMDLALRVIRAHAGPLLVCWLVGVVPCAALNHWVLRGWLVHFYNAQDFPYGYCWYSLVLTVWELPLATAPITLYLSQALFTERPSAGQIVQTFFARFGQVFWFQGCLRGMFAFWILVTLALDGNEGLLGFLSFMTILVWLVMGLGWPYLNEVLLLERNRLFKKRGGMSTLSRAMAMHSNVVGDLIARALGAVFFGGLLTLSLWLAQDTTRGVLTLDYDHRPATMAVELQVALWLVVGYLAVVRFLSYLDLRIRSEGWEVELVMRAEGARIARQLS